MNFSQIVAGNIVSMFMNCTFIVITAVILMGKPSDGGLRYWLRVIGTICLIVIGCAILGAVMLKNGLMDIPYLSEGLMDYSLLIGGSLLLKALYGKNKKICWFTMVIIGITLNIGSYLGFLLSPDKVFRLAIMDERLTYMFFLWVIAPLCMLGVSIILYITGAGRHYRQWLDYGIIRKDMLIFISSYPLLLVFIERMIEQFERNNGSNFMITILLLLMIYVLFVYISRQDMQKQQIDAQKINLQQQAAYIKNLESLQHEVRRFRHDFKNMMSGMYLQTQDGNISAVQTFIQNITADFDHQVEGELKLMNQLANIHHLAVKSLVLTKLEQMKQSNIHYHLEVFRTFDKTQLRETDLCRCLGILIDNAIEAVQGHPEGQIHMIISRQGDNTTFLVKNTLHEVIDFHKIGTVGYSTKNKDRGVGLASYHRILSQYGFALPSTTVKNGFFIQELKIIEK